MTEPIAIISNRFPQVVCPQIDCVKNSVRIIIFDWRFRKSVLGSGVFKLNQAIINAVKRGVEVRALVSSDAVVQALRALGVQARMLNSRKMLHTKLLILDDKTVVLGSHNYTQSAFHANEEASIMVEMPDASNDFVKYFEALWGV